MPNLGFAYLIRIGKVSQRDGKRNNSVSTVGRQEVSISNVSEIG
jgi:hypothetical protein